MVKLRRVDIQHKVNEMSQPSIEALIYLYLLKHTLLLKE